ncbi:antiviral protein I [Spinacia oleracea]|uniref:rRNA N-glycosylase n=1 Tax=Spinacia oleracea TaxID=3562 RepID=A0A9R0JNX2_SPIOL|nr:antiviral protein I-like [Spinacia oleracea]
MERKTVKSFVVVAISIWVILVEAIITASGLDLDVGIATKTTYSKLLTDIRDNVKDPKLKYGGTNIPVMAKEGTSKLLLIDLKSSDGKTITIGISKEDKFNLYVQGYLDKVVENNREVFRAHIFPDASAYAKANMFIQQVPIGNKYRLPMKYKSTYGDIEKNGGSRTKLGLGVKQLNKFINNVYGKPFDAKTEAQFMLIVIQTIAEATRFKYIENMILAKFDSFENKPDPKTIELEVSWQKITKGIKSSNAEGEIKPELILKDAKGKTWKVNKVSQIAPDMGLLKYEG